MSAAVKGSIDKADLFSPLNIFACVAALAAFMLVKKYGQPVLTKAQAALPAGK